MGIAFWIVAAAWFAVPVLVAGGEHLAMPFFEALPRIGEPAVLGIAGRLPLVLICAHVRCRPGRRHQ